MSSPSRLVLVMALLKGLRPGEKNRFQTAGTIEKEVGGVRKTYRFVRADRSTMVEEVTDIALAKGRLIIDEQGEGLFD